MHHPYAMLANLNTHLVVCGGGGFLGGHLVRHLVRMGYRRVRAVDLKPVEEWEQSFEGVENLQLDLRDRRACRLALDGANMVFNLAAAGEEDRETPQVMTMLNSLINTHLLMAASESRTCRHYVFASSSEVYPLTQVRLDDDSAESVEHGWDGGGRKESWSYPAMPPHQMGWEKLFAERMCRQFMLDYGVATYVARIHPVYGSHLSLDRASNGSPLDLCKRIAWAQLHQKQEIEIRGNASDTHCWTYVDDCVLGLTLIVRSGTVEPVNLGSSEVVTTGELVDLIQGIAETNLKPVYRAEVVNPVEAGPSDNTWIREAVEWQPSTSLREGLRATYDWVYAELARDHQPHDQDDRGDEEPEEVPELLRKAG